MELGKGVLTNGTIHRIQHSTATDLHLDGNSVGKDAFGDFVRVRLFIAATANPRDGNRYRSNRITTDSVILGKDSETLAGRDDHHVPNDSEDYQPDHRKSFEEVHWGMG